MYEDAEIELGAFEPGGRIFCKSQLSSLAIRSGGSRGLPLVPPVHFERDAEQSLIAAMISVDMSFAVL
jgi:hypothetical protein